MLVAVICTDKADSLQTRLDNRPAHREHIANSGVVAMAGPFLGTNGEMNGSLIVLNVETLAEAEAWAAADPYAKAGLFESVQIREWNKVTG